MADDGADDNGVGPIMGDWSDLARSDIVLVGEDVATPLELEAALEGGDAFETSRTEEDMFWGSKTGAGR